ncbi:hypothetical protein OG871_09180 [Kitasatospora sp. NBC_00374]|uniref:hypothetical protein n=1 Tax=Kitasatospora sp. NBC_00374 TaxID=2975964 RepID=UPI003253592B
MRLRATLLACTAIAALTLSACSGSGADSGGSSAPAAASGAPSTAVAPSEPAPQGSAPASQPPAPEASKSAPPADAGLPPAPDGAATAKLVAALDAIDPDIVAGKPDKAVEAARTQCQAIYNFPKDRAKLIALAEQRFTSPAHPGGFGPEKAEKILAAVQSTLCDAPR